MMSVPAILKVPSKRGDKMRETRAMLGEITGRMWREVRDMGGDAETGKTIIDTLRALPPEVRSRS